MSSAPDAPPPARRSACRRDDPPPQQPEPIPNEYVVVFKDHVTSEQRSAHRAWAAEQHFSVLSTTGRGQGTNGLLFKFNIDEQCAGYVAHLPAEVAQQIDGTDEVDFVEPNHKVYAKNIVNVDSPSWGLARLSHNHHLTSATRRTYTYDDEAAGDGITAYVIDTGVLAEHEDFEGRATFGYNAVPGSSDTDMNGHGTHVSGTIGGKVYGVAKQVNIIGVKVLNDEGEGSDASVIAGIDWAVRDARRRGITKCVANMSLGGDFSRSLNQVAKRAVDSGLTLVVAAGNEGLDARTGSPSSEPSVITVGAVDINESAPDWSNFGSLVDVFAPGVNITSSYIDTTGGGATDSTFVADGTSMASPHVCGLAAYLKSKDSSLGAPSAVMQRIKSLGLQRQLVARTLRGGSVNLLAHSSDATD